MQFVGVNEGAELHIECLANGNVIFERAFIFTRSNCTEVRFVDIGFLRDEFLFVAVVIEIFLECNVVEHTVHLLIQ